MMPMFSWRACAIILATIAMLIAVQSAYQRGGRYVQSLWDADKVVQLHAAYETEVENRRMETKRQTGVIDAQNAQAKRTSLLQADSDGARAAAASLRDTVSAASSALPSYSAAAVGHYAATTGQLFVDCSAALADMGRQADGHASDSLMLQQAWPK